MDTSLDGFLQAQSTEFFEPAKELVNTELLKSKPLTGGLRIIDIPLVYATEKSLQGFGKIVEDFTTQQVFIERWPQKIRPVQGGNLGGTAEGLFKCQWLGDNCIVSNEAINLSFIVGTRIEDDILITYANYHPDCSQIFYNEQQTPFIIVLAKPCADEIIKPSDFVAFYCDGKRAIELNVGTWHQANFPANVDQSVTLQNKQGKVHGVVEVLFDKEYGVSLRVKGALNGRLPLSIDNLLMDVVRPAAVFPPSQYVIHILEKQEENCPAIIETEIRNADSESIKPYGDLLNCYDLVSIDIVPWPRKARALLYGNEAGVTESVASFILKDNCVITEGNNKYAGLKLENHGAEVKGLFGRAFKQVDSSKVIFPAQNDPFAMLLSNYDDEGSITLKHFSIFTFRPHSGIHLKPNIWHSNPLSLHGVGKFKVKKGAVSAYVEVDFEQEFQACHGLRITSDGFL